MEIKEVLAKKTEELQVLKEKIKDTFNQILGQEALIQELLNKLNEEIK